MSTYDPNAVRVQLKTLLDTLTGVGGLIQIVYSYRAAAVSGYPAIIFDITNEEAQMLDDSNNIRKLTFTIWIICELPVSGESAASVILDNATKAVINLLEKKTNAELSSTVDWTMPVMGQRAEVAGPEGNTIYQEVKLECNVASSIL